MKRLDAALLVGVGVLAVHQLAYTASSMLGADSAVGHGHLAAAWLVGGFAAVVGLARSVARSLRRRQHSPLSPMAMSAAIGAGYAGMESLERFLDGSSVAGLVTEAVFWLGLLATPAVAAALRSMVRSIHELAERWVSVGPRAIRPRSAPATFGHTSIELAPLLLRSNTVSRRGPPVRLFT